MLDKLKNIAEKAKNAVSSTAVIFGDLNGDGKVDLEDAKIAAQWAKKAANAAGDEAIKLGKHAMQSDMVKDAAAGAAVGAVVAIPVPVIGPLAGAAIGAGLGVYKNLTKKESQAKEQPEVSKDVYAELLKLDDLRQKGIVTDAEFESQKRKLFCGI
jgi:hypothetical protein